MGGSAGDNAKREIETALIMRWSEKWAMNGVLNYHEGALVANYPWDGNDDGSTSYSAAPDDATFRYLASSYAQAHPTMSKSAEFEGGITNGAAWYPLWGGMQDWHYVQTGTYSLTVEVDDEKWPSEDKLGAIVDEHVNASIDVCARALFGSVRGFVRDERGAAVVGASIVVGRDSAPVKTDAPMVTTLAAIFVSRWRQTTSGSLVVSREPGWHCPILIGAGRYLTRRMDLHFLQVQTVCRVVHTFSEGNPKFMISVSEAA